MTATKLWSEEPNTILAQPLAQEVLRELGEPQPESLYDDLLRTVRTRLLSGPRP